MHPNPRTAPLLPACLLLLTASPFLFGQDHVDGHLLGFRDNGAWSWFEDERAIVDPLHGRVLVGSCADSSGLGGALRGGDIDVAWLDLTAGRFGAFELHDRLQGDDHDSPALLLRPDGRYLAMYGMHGGSTGANQSRWRISLPGDPTQWSAEASFAHAVAMSYSNLFFLRDSGRTYNFVRAVNWDPNVMWSADQGATWSGAGKLLTEGGTGDRPYLKYACDGRSRIHVLTSNRHPRNFDNSIFHGYVENDALHDSFGNVVDANVLDGAGQPPTRLSTVFQTGTSFGGTVMRRAWTIDLAVDGNDVRALYEARANDSNTDHRLFFARFDGASWTSHEVCRLGAYLYASEDDYTGLAALHPDRPDTIYVSTRIDPRSGTPTGHYEIYCGVTPDQGASWIWTAVTADSSVDNLRPIVPAWDAQRTALLWLRGGYSAYTDFDLAVVGRIDAPELTFAPALFHDAGTTNTTLANGLPANPTGPTSGQGADDGLWHLRSGYGNGGTVWTASETGAEDAPLLRTRIANVAPGRHDVFVVFWSNPNDDWSLRAGFAAGALRNIEKRAAAMVDNAHFTAPLINSSGTVRAYSVWLGRTSPDANGNLDVYIDDFDTGQGSSSRSWYDGIALAPVANVSITQGAGQGCNGNASLDATGTPQLGAAMQVRLAGGTPGSWAMGVIGFPLLGPVSLQHLGLSGCTLYVSPSATLPLGAVAQNGQSPPRSVAIPNDPSLRDLRLGLQAVALGAVLELTAAVVLLPGS